MVLRSSWCSSVDVVVPVEVVPATGVNVNVGASAGSPSLGPSAIAACRAVSSSNATGPSPVIGTSKVYAVFAKQARSSQAARRVRARCPADVALRPIGAALLVRRIPPLIGARVDRQRRVGGPARSGKIEMDVPVPNRGPVDMDLVAGNRADNRRNVDITIGDDCYRVDRHLAGAAGRKRACSPGSRLPPRA